MDGPWTTEWATEPLDHNLQSIRQAITHAPHQCLVAEIRYDDAPIVPNATSSTSDKLAQRNIAWIDGPNPGVVASRRMTYPVQFRPTPVGAPHPDELMIFWGRTPAASQAQLYLPALRATEIGRLANRLYPAQQTRIVDEHTVGFDANGATFVPLPSGAALAAGLLTVTLPPGARSGDQYTITVRQMGAASLTFAPPPPPPPPPQVAQSRAAKRGSVKRPRAAPAESPPFERTWRRVSGAFQFVINIKHKEDILLSEERLLATLRWIVLSMPTTKRWYPVLLRYIDYVAGRVQGFGGNPGQILPSPTGWVPGFPKHLPSPQPPPYHHDHDIEEFTGKIQGLIYDHFGDFEGFVLETETGAHHRVFSRERAVRELARHAQIERCRVQVLIERHHRRLRQVIVL